LSRGVDFGVGPNNLSSFPECIDIVFGIPLMPAGRGFERFKDRLQVRSNEKMRIIARVREEDMYV